MEIALWFIGGALFGMVIGVLESKRFISKLAEENESLKAAAHKIADKL